MSIYLDSKADLVASFNAATGSSATSADLVFATPKTPTTVEVTQFAKNTKINAAFSTKSTLGTGSTPLFYDRLNVSALNNANLKFVILTAGLNLTTMIGNIKAFIGAVFTVDDLVDHSSTVNANGTISFIVETKPTSLGWTGTTTLTFGVPN